ncbi:hypothetical protein BC827DRAFT_1138285, partial [Russula dissimulans]
NKYLKNLKEQRTFEKGLFAKTKKHGGDIMLYDGHLAVYKHSLDFIFYMLEGSQENKFMLHSALIVFMDAIYLLLRNQVEKRAADKHQSTNTHARFVEHCQQDVIFSATREPDRECSSVHEQHQVGVERVRMYDRQKYSGSSSGGGGICGCSGIVTTTLRND